jgi:hypothetical protein
MERVIVTVQRSGEAQGIDLEMSTDLPVEAILQEIGLSLGWQGNLQAYADPPGRLLQPYESLAQAGVEEGAFLFLQYAGRPLPESRFSSGTAAPAPGPGRSDTEGPVVGWRRLEGVSGDSGGAPPSSPSSPPSSGGFVWKQIDED